MAAEKLGNGVTSYRDGYNELVLKQCAGTTYYVYEFMDHLECTTSSRYSDKKDLPRNWIMV